MRLYVHSKDLTVHGLCEACNTRIDFAIVDDNSVIPYYEAEEVVNKWMDHQLNDCKAPVIDTEVAKP